MSLSIEIICEPGGVLPQYATEGAAGMDLCANEELILQPGEFFMVPTGIKIALPQGYEAQVRPRSGLAARHGIGLVNSPGTIDCDYRGEIKVVMINHGKTPFPIQKGDRIAQLVVAPVTRVSWNKVDKIEITERGERGFGSTGRQ